MTKLDFSLRLSSPSSKLIKLATDYENFSAYLPGQIKSIKIIESNSEKTITEEVLVFSTLKISIEQRSVHTKMGNNQLFTEIISGPIKNSNIKTTYNQTENGTEVIINLDLHVSLKYKILIPIIKKLYKSILTGILYKMDFIEE